MGNILDTEAAIITDTLWQRDKAIINKLSGTVGEVFLKLFPVVYDITGLKGTNPALYFGFTFISDKTNNLLKVCSSIKEFPLNKGDEIIFHLKHGSRIEITLSNSPIRASREKHAFASLMDFSLAYLNSDLTKDVQFINTKTGKTLSASFNGNTPNDQYRTELEGQQLLQLMVHRITGAKSLL